MLWPALPRRRLVLDPNRAVTDDRVAIFGSEVNRSGALRPTEAADPNEAIEATIVIRRPATAQHAAADLLAGRHSGKTREEIETQLAADPADVKTVIDFARRHGLTVVEQSPVKRAVRVAGTLQQMNIAFGIQLAYVAGTGGSRFLSYDGPLKVPAAVSPAITAVLGLHREPVASPRSARS